MARRYIHVCIHFYDMTKLRRIYGESLISNFVGECDTLFNEEYVTTAPFLLFSPPYRRNEEAVELKKQ